MTYKKIRKSTLCIALTFIVSVVAACGIEDNTLGNISSVSEAEIVGIWEGHYSRHDGVEILIIKSDGTYQQVFQDSDAYLYVSNFEEWHLETNTSGRLFIRFEGGKYFPEGPKFAEQLGVDPLEHSRLYAFYDPDTGGAIYMENELLLEILPSNNSKGIVFAHFPSDIDAKREIISPVQP